MKRYSGLCLVVPNAACSSGDEYHSILERFRHVLGNVTVIGSGGRSRWIQPCVEVKDTAVSDTGVHCNCDAALMMFGCGEVG
jgi:hypothetical protein